MKTRMFQWLHTTLRQRAFHCNIWSTWTCRCSTCWSNESSSRTSRLAASLFPMIQPRVKLNVRQNFFWFQSLIYFIFWWLGISVCDKLSEEIGSSFLISIARSTPVRRMIKTIAEEKKIPTVQVQFGPWSLPSTTAELNRMSKYQSAKSFPNAQSLPISLCFRNRVHRTKWDSCHSSDL